MHLGTDHEYSQMSIAALWPTERWLVFRNTLTSNPGCNPNSTVRRVCFLMTHLTDCCLHNLHETVGPIRLDHIVRYYLKLKSEPPISYKLFSKHNDHHAVVSNVGVVIPVNILKV